MVKKMHKAAPASDAAQADTGSTPRGASTGLLDSQLAQTVKDSAQQIWLAGLGAFAKAQGGGGKVFDALMKEGASLQRKTQTAAEETLGDVAGKMTAMAGEVGHKANAQWDKLETIFEERTGRALAKLGVPSAKQLAALAARVDALAAAVAQLGVAAAPAPEAKPAKPAKPAKAAKAAEAAAAAPLLARRPKFRPGKGATAKPVVAPAPAPAASRPARKAAKTAATAVADAPAKPSARKRAKPAA